MFEILPRTSWRCSIWDDEKATKARPVTNCDNCVALLVRNLHIKKNAWNYLKIKEQSVTYHCYSIHLRVHFLFSTVWKKKKSFPRAQLSGVELNLSPVCKITSSFLALRASKIPPGKQVVQAPILHRDQSPRSWALDLSQPN